MSDLLYGRILNVLLGALLPIAAGVYIAFIRRHRADHVARVAAAFVAVPAMGALVIFQIHLFRVVTGVGSPVHSDTVFFATVMAEGIASLVVIFRGALKARNAAR
jgi:hypothetical protein